MGHQFFERLAGKHINVLQVEMAQERPDLARAADAACKIVHHQVQRLVASGDLGRLLAVLNRGLDKNSSSPSDIEIIAGLRSCVYRDEAERIAFEVRRALGIKACAVDDLMASAAALFANQLSRPEMVFRLLRDGPDGARELGDKLVNEISQRVTTNLRSQRDKNPDGWRDNKWRAPRARAKKSSPGNLGNDFDVSS